MLFKKEKKIKNVGVKLLLIVVLLQKLTLKIRAYQKLKKMKPFPSEKSRAKHPKKLACWGAELTVSQPETEMRNLVFSNYEKSFSLRDRQKTYPQFPQIPQKIKCFTPPQQADHSCSALCRRPGHRHIAHLALVCHNPPSGKNHCTFF